MVTAAMNWKMLAPWKKTYDKPRQHIKKQRHYFTDKGPSSHVWMWELDHKESRESTLWNCGAVEDSWESLGQQGDQTSQSLRKSTLNIHWKDWCWGWSSNTLATWCKKSWVIGKYPDAGKDWKRKEKGMAEDEMVGWHLWLNGHEFE